MEFKTVSDLLEWLHQQYNAEIELPTYGSVSFHLYNNKVDLRNGGVKGCLWLGPAGKVADMGFLEKKPGFLTVAVVPNGELSIDWTNVKRFAASEPLEALLEEFTDGRNIGPIVETLKNFNG